MNWIVLSGPQKYADVLARQQALFSAYIDKPALSEDSVILCQHMPTLTLGRRTHDSHFGDSEAYFKKNGVDVVAIQRGGSVTVHEPGQLVIYPIIHLGKRGWTVSEYVGALLRWVTAVARDFGVEATTCPDNDAFQPASSSASAPSLTGVWVGRKKLASVGIYVKQRVTMHGIALNVNNDCALFQKIAPCGIQGLEMTSLSKEISRLVVWDALILSIQTRSPL